jgi:hypothetical protein
LRDGLGCGWRRRLARAFERRRRRGLRRRAGARRGRIDLRDDGESSDQTHGDDHRENVASKSTRCNHARARSRARG